MTLRKLLLSAVAGLSLVTAASAQVNTVPQVGVNTANIRQQTYSAISVALVPASAATDLFCIAASQSRSVAVRRIEVSGTATTALTTPLILLRRATVDTGGTAATGLALPVGGTNYSLNSAATAVLTAYTANPTITDSSPTYLRVNAINFSPAATAVSSDALFWHGGTATDFYDQGFDMVKGSTQQLCLNLNGGTIAGGSLSINIEWTEQ